MSDDKIIDEYMLSYQIFNLSDNGVPLLPPMDAIKEAFKDGLKTRNNKLEKLQAENKLLREQHERDSNAISSIVNILISEGLQYKHKTRLERIFERQANQGER